MTRELPQFLHDLLAAPPRAGEGVHAWLYRVARQLHAHLPAVEIVVLLESRVQGCGRHVSRQEIQDAVKNSLSCAWQPRFTGAPIQSTSKWPTVNQEQRAAIIRDGGGLVELWEAILPNEMWAGAEKFRQWGGSAGNFTFGHKGGAGNTELQLLQVDVTEEAAYRMVKLIEYCGWHQTHPAAKGVPPLGLWFLKDCAVVGDGVVILPDGDGIIWHEGIGYAPSQKGRELEFCHGVPALNIGEELPALDLSRRARCCARRSGKWRP